MPGWRILLWVVLVFATLFFLYLVRGILLPFIVAFIFAALLEPGVRRLRLRGMSRGMAVSIVALAFYGVLAVAVILLAPGVSRETIYLTDRVQDLTTSLTRQSENDNFFVRWNPVIQTQQTGAGSQVDQLLAQYSGTLERLGLPTTRREIMEQYVDKNRPQITRAVKNVFNGAFGFLTSLPQEMLFAVLVPILVLFILLDMDEFKKKGPRFIPPSIRGSVMTLIDDIGQVFVRYLRGISTVVLLYASIMTFYLWLMGVPAWILLGPLFAALYLVPYLGNIINATSLFLVIGTSGATGHFFHPFASSWVYALVVTAIYVAIGLTFDQLVYPQMVGNSVGLGRVTSMFVILSGGALFGLPGMIIAFPLAGSIKVIMDRLLRVTSSGQESLQLPTVPLRHRPT